MYGAAFDSDMNVKHIRATKLEEIDRIKGSKYVFSSIKDINKQILKDLLCRDLYVLLTGTPCQIAKIYSFLQSKECDDSKLLSVDLICHGTPKIKLWKKYILFLEEKYGSKIEKFSFREKDDVKEKGHLFVKFANGKTLIDTGDLKSYMSLFANNLSLNEICFSCKHRNKNLKRPADITVGDFWGIHEVLPQFHAEGDVSLVMANTAKGEKIIKSIIENVTSFPYIKIQQCTSFDFLLLNNHLYKQLSKPKNYDDFWVDFDFLKMTDLFKKYRGGFKKKIKRFLSSLLDRIGLKWKIKFWLIKISGSNVL